MTQKIKWQFRRFYLLRRVLTFLGIIGALGSATPASASIEQERTILETRVAAAREAIRNLEKDNHPSNTGTPSYKKLAQWYPWGNWGNWGNWRNWFNGR